MSFLFTYKDNPDLTYKAEIKGNEVHVSLNQVNIFDKDIAERYIRQGIWVVED